MNALHSQEPRIEDQDAFYEALVDRLDAREDLDDAYRYAVRLVLMLANEVGDRQTLMRALDAAETSGDQPSSSSDPHHSRTR